MSLSYDHIAIDAVQPARRNARTHSPKQIAQIAESIRTFGFTNPVLIDETDVLIAGHGRLEAAKSLGLKTVPAIRIPNLSEPAKRALMLADNKIALNAGWDLDILADELADLSSMELEFDVATTGFEVAEIDLIIDACRDDAAVAEEALEPDRTLPAITQPGDLWQLGPHRRAFSKFENMIEHARVARLGRGNLAWMLLQRDSQRQCFQVKHSLRKVRWVNLSADGEATGISRFAQKSS